MALIWVNTLVINNSSSGHDGTHELVEVQPGSTLKRTIVRWYINVSSSDSAVLGTWASQGVLALVEATEGTPPPAPAVIGTGGFGSRDILDSAMAGLGWGGVFNNQFRVPDVSVGVIAMDTPVQRRADTDAVSVWFNWGLADFGGAGVEVGFEKVWARCLVDIP